MNIKQNIISNFLGNGYVVILQIALVPFLLKYLGAEAYGLIGVYVTLLAAFNMIDLGLSPALSRELARLSTSPSLARLMRSTVTTLECIYIVIALLIIGVFYFFSPLIAEYWLNNNSLPKTTISTCLQLMGVQCAMQFLTNYYTYGLQGLQQIILANTILAANHTFRAVAGLFVLVALSAGVEVYFYSQLIFTLMGLFLTAFALYQVLPKADVSNNLMVLKWQKLKSRFSLERFNACKRFAAGMTIISTCSFFIMQVDKIILSKLVSLEQFGYYAAAVSVAVTVSGAAGMVSRSVLPRMTQLVAQNEIEQLEVLYLKSSALVAWIVLPISGSLIVFRHHFLSVYLGDIDKVEHITSVFALLMFGYAVHSLLYIPMALSLAYGWTRYGVNISLLAIIAFTPITIYSIFQYGIVGAAATWVLLSIGYLILSPIYLHRKLLKGFTSKLYLSFTLQLMILFIMCLYSYIN